MSYEYMLELVPNFPGKSYEASSHVQQLYFVLILILVLG